MKHTLAPLAAALALTATLTAPAFAAKDVVVAVASTSPLWLLGKALYQPRHKK